MRRRIRHLHVANDHPDDVASAKLQQRRSGVVLSSFLTISLTASELFVYADVLDIKLKRCFTVVLCLALLYMQACCLYCVIVYIMSSSAVTKLSAVSCIPVLYLDLTVL